MSASRGKYIVREAAIEAVEKERGYFAKFSYEEADPYMLGYQQGITFALVDIVTIPAADVRPVVHGEWKWNDSNGYYYCDKCGCISPREDQDGEYCDCPNYCPNCGADMRGEDLL